MEPRLSDLGTGMVPSSWCSFPDPAAALALLPFPPSAWDQGCCRWKRLLDQARAPSFPAFCILQQTPSKPTSRASSPVPDAQSYTVSERLRLAILASDCIHNYRPQIHSASFTTYGGGHS